MNFVEYWGKNDYFVRFNFKFNNVIIMVIKKAFCLEVNSQISFNFIKLYSRF